MSFRIIAPSTSLPKQAYRLFFRRSYSTGKSARISLFPSSAFLGGFLGGFLGLGSVALTGYAYYHYSGAKNVVDRVKPAMALLGQSREDLVKDAPRRALHYLREAAKAYIASIPFAGTLIDKVFDAIGDLVLPHSEEATAIIWRAYDDIWAIIQENGNEHRVNGARRIISVAGRLLKELTSLGLKAGQPVSDQLELKRRAGDVMSQASTVYEAVKSRAVAVTNKLDVEKNIDNAKTQASTSYEAVKSGVLSIGSITKDKTKGLLESHSKSQLGSEARSQESIQKPDIE